MYFIIKKKNPVRYQNWNFAGLFLIPFYLNIIDRAMIEMFPYDDHFLFPLFIHGYMISHGKNCTVFEI